MLTKIKKEIERTKKKLPFFGKVYKELVQKQYGLDNLPYELYDKIKNKGFTVPIPIIRNAGETIDKILQDKCSLSRFGDGEFNVMEGGHINFQNRSPLMAKRLKEVILSNVPNLLVGLPPCFGDLDGYVPLVVNFWRKHMARRRTVYYSYLDMNRVYYDAFFSRPYIQFCKTDEHYKKCGEYFRKIKSLWAGKNVVICEGEGTRFGMFNDLLDGAKSISRILCPPRNAFDKYDEILKAFDGIDKQTLVLAALGPTATVLAYDLCNRGFQAIDIGHFDLEYEWFLSKETMGEGLPKETTRVSRNESLNFKYRDGIKEGMKIRPLEIPEYQKQIMKKIV